MSTEHPRRVEPTGNPRVDALIDAMVCPTCRTIWNAEKAGCSDLWHYDNKHCPARYERPGGAQPGDRIVACHLRTGHPGEHEEEGTEVTWWGEHTPGRGLERLKRELPGMVPDLSEEDLRKADEIIGRAGSTPVSEEPARPTGSTEEPSPESLAAATEFVKRRYSYDPANYVSEAARLAHLARDAYSTTQDPAFREPWLAGISEGQRRATEGWEREWGVRDRESFVFREEDEDEAHRLAALVLGAEPVADVVSRLVGPWEPAEQSPAVKHALPSCACGINDAGQRFVDPICRKPAAQPGGTGG